MTKTLLTIPFLFLIACGQPAVKSEADSTAKPKLIDGWKTLTEKEYSIQYPPSWELSQKGEAGTIMVLLSALEDNEDKFRENVNLVTENITDNTMNLDKYAELSENQVKTYITDGAVVEKKKVKNGNTEFYQVMYTGKQGIFKMQFEQYYCIENNKAYVITFTCEQNKFSKFKEEGENILNSFSLNK